MYAYEHHGRKFISINGKDYFLVRGFQSDRNKFIFIQLSGKTPLNKEDLPNGDWSILRTRTGKQRIWTAFSKSYFRYQQDQEERKLLFIGANSQGSCYLALRWLARSFNQTITEETLLELAKSYSTEKVSIYRLKLLDDQGNLQEKAALLDLDSRLNNEDAEKILKGGKSHERTRARH